MGLRNIVLCVGAVTAASGKTQPPCCSTCETGKEKYYSIPNPADPNPQCGECCLRPSLYHFWKLFEPKLLKGDCASYGFTKYVSTETDGVPPLAVTNDRFNREECPENLHAIFADMHDGDKKEIAVSGTSMTIKPSGNNQTWIIKADLDRKSCSASIDFNVPGKPSPPPVNLTATLWYSWINAGYKTEVEFTDPSGKLAASTFPLNRWVELNLHPKQFKMGCPSSSFQGVFADMHDGDKKEVTIQGDAVTIKPSGNNQTWVINTKLDRMFCTANVDFNVPGKPSPPPVNLTATFLYNLAQGQEPKLEAEFTDPTGTLAASDFPLNHWVELKKEAQTAEIVI